MAGLQLAGRESKGLPKTYLGRKGSVWQGGRRNAGKEEREPDQPGAWVHFLSLFSLSCKTSLANVLAPFLFAFPVLTITLTRSKTRFVANKNENNITGTSFQKNRKRNEC